MDANTFVSTLKTPATPPADTNKLHYLLLAVFLGSFGVHNFWFGVTEKAKVQCLTGLIGSLVCGIGPVVSWITAVWEAWTFYNAGNNGK